MYTIEQKALIMSDRKAGISYEEISNKFSIPRPSIQYIIQNYANNHVKRGPKEKITKMTKDESQVILQVNMRKM